MTTSRNKEFNPLVREIIDEAYEICGLDPQDLEDRALRSARRSLNQLLAGFITQFTPQWLLTPASFRAGGETEITNETGIGNIVWVPEDTTITEGRTSGYIQFPDGVDQLQALSLRLDDQNSFPVPLEAMTASDWNDYPIRGSGRYTMAQPYWYYFRRTDAPRAYLIYQPDKPYTFDGMMVLTPDAVISSNETVDIPRRWQEAISTGLAYKLAIKVAPDRVAMLKPIYDEALMKAKESEDDGVPLTLQHQEFV